MNFLNAPDAARIADLLTRYTQSKQIVRDEEGVMTSFSPSLRYIERRTAEAGPEFRIPHQRLSEFMRNPESATPTMVERIARAIEAPTLQTEFKGIAVTYVDAPVFTPSLFEAFPAPKGAVAYRFVVETDDERYMGFRSSEWVADFDQMGELARNVPGGLDAITRIVFDTGE